MHQPVTVGIQAYEAQDRSLRISEDIALRLGIADEQTYTIRCGQRKATATVSVTKGSSTEVSLSSRLAKRLLVPVNATIQCSKQGRYELRLGPAVGIFVRPRYLAALKSGKGSSDASAFTEVNVAEKIDCLLYFFGTRFLDFQRKRVKGCCLIDGKWQYRWLPLPDAIYEWGYRNHDKEPVNRFRKYTRKLRIPRVNKVERLGKWETCRALARDPVTAAHLPDTIKVKSFRDVLRFTERHERVFLKGDHGNRGRQVIMVVKKGTLFKTTTHQGTSVWESPQDLADYISTFLGSGTRYIAQQGISLMQIGDRKMDLRVVVAKDRRGMWTVAYNIVRVAQPAVSITNYALGASLAWPVEAFRQAGWSTAKARALEARTNALSIAIAERLDQEFGPLGDLGVDLGVDQVGRIWVFEVNSRPSKAVHESGETALPIPQYLRTHYRRILEYCLFLSDSSNRRQAAR